MEKHYREPSKSNVTTVLSIDEHICGITEEIPKNKKIFALYAEMFLLSISIKTLQSKNFSEWFKFLEDRYRFFNEVLEEKKDFRFSTNKDKSCSIFEWVYFSAIHSEVTIENLFQEFGLNINLRIKTLMGIQRDKDKNIKEINLPSTGSEKIATLYLELDAIDLEVIEKLKAKIAIHTSAIHAAANDQKLMRDHLTKLKGVINSQEKFSTIEPQEEWGEMVEWIKNNVYLCGYASFH